LTVYSKLFPVPADATRERSPTRATGISYIEVTLNGPVVGYIELSPP
jgi:hypothetical protein